MTIEYINGKPKIKIITDDHKIKKAAEILIQKIKQKSFRKIMEYIDENGLPLYPRWRDVAGFLGLIMLIVFATLMAWIKPFGDDHRHHPKEAAIQYFGPIFVVFLGLILSKMLMAISRGVTLDKSGFLIDRGARMIAWNDVKKIEMIEGFVFTSMRISMASGETKKFNLFALKNDIFLQNYISLHWNHK